MPTYTIGTFFCIQGKRVKGMKTSVKEILVYTNKITKFVPN
ncbi:hypothetical protein EVA_16477 [gut metagenome]|uniref:Uncharacterized protein n=1 Tax=gut metagenome TaxID=749906 RepID=J9G7F5_9ZZZZ